MKSKVSKFLDYGLNIKKSISVIFLTMIFGGVFGFIYELIFYKFDKGIFINRGSTYGPWIPVYAFGAFFICVLLYRLRKKPWLVILLSAVITFLMEYLTGYYFLTYKGVRLWDYNVEILNFGNIGGFVCLRSVLFFGISSLLLIYGIVPFVFYIATKMNRKTFIVMSITICAVFLIDEIYNLVIARIFDLSRASDIYKKIGFNYMKF